MKSSFICAGILIVLLTSCRTDQKVEVKEDSTKTKESVSTSTKESAPHDTAQTSVKTDTAGAKPASDLPPMAKPIEPDRLANYLPKMDGWLHGELEKEIKVRKNFNSSRVLQTYTKDGKKFIVEINDYAYVPFLYQPFEQYKGDYLQDDNQERTESTKLEGFQAVQTWEKSNKRANIFVFPGKRYVVQITGESLTNIDEARDIAKAINLTGLSNLE